MCAGNAAFSHAIVVSESKIVRQMLCFTIETAVGGCEGRRCETAGAAMLAYGRLCSRIAGSVLHWEMQSHVIKRIVTVVSRWPWVVGLRRCARGEVHAKSCKSHCNGGVKVALGGRLAALC